MATKNRAACTPDEQRLYLEDYFATDHLLTTAIGKFETLTDDATIAAERNPYRAQAIEAERQVELLRNKLRAFLDNEAAINPPSMETVEKAKRLAEKLGKTAAKEAKGEAIIAMVANGLDAFNKIHAAA